MKDEKTQIHIKSISKSLKERHQNIAKERGLTFSKYLTEMLENNDPLEQYKKLYEETLHQQAVNTKVMKEMVDKLDEIHKIIKQIEEE